MGAGDRRLARAAHGDGLIAMQYREVQDGPTRQIISALKSSAARIRLEREGDYVWFSVAPFKWFW